MTLIWALTLASDLATALLVGLLLLVARFYQRASGESSGYVWFLVPAAFYLASGWSEWQGARTVHDPLSNGLRFLGGVSLFTLCYRLYRQMTASRS